MSQSPFERGFKHPDPHLPANNQGEPFLGGSFPISSSDTHIGRIGTNKTHSLWFDEALRFGLENAERMTFDPMIYGCLSVRSSPVASLKPTIAPDDPGNPREVETARRMQELIRSLPRLCELQRFLLINGIFKGRSGAMLKWGWNHKQQAIPTGFQLIDGDKLVFFRDGRIGVRCNALAMQQYTPEERKVRFEQFDGGLAFVLSIEEQASTLVHKHFSEDGNFYYPWFSSHQHGVGVRHRLFWLWAMKSQIWRMSIDLIRWLSKGILIFYSQSSNDAHLQKLQSFIKNLDGDSAMVLPVNKDSNNDPYLNKFVEMFQPNMSSNDFLQNLITQYFDDQIRFVILHQSLTTTTASTGLGSGVAAAHQNTFETLVKLDSESLSASWIPIVEILYKLNAPGVPPGRLFYQVDSPNVQQVLDSAAQIVSLGGQVPQEPLMEAAGIPEAKESDHLLGSLEQNQAVVDQLPPNVDAAEEQPLGDFE